MSLNLSQEFMAFAGSVNIDYFPKSHGQKILQFLIVEALDFKGLLDEFSSTEEDKFKIFQEDEFILSLIKQFQISRQSPEQFLKFISYQYMSQQFNIYKDVTLNILNYLTDTDCIETYIHSKKNFKSQKRQQIQQQEQYQQQQKIQQSQKQSINAIDGFFNNNFRNNSQQSPPASLNNSQNQYNTLTQKLSGYYQKEIPQQINQIPQRQNLPEYQNNSYQNLDQSRQVLYSQFNNLKQPHQEIQQKIINQRKEVSNKANFASFQEFIKQSESIKDGISYLVQLQQKYIFFEFTYDISVFNGNQFRCFYESKPLQIQKVYSDVHSKKKDAQHDAAKKFIPHLLYYIKYKKPYFEDDDQEMLYLKSIKESTQINNLNQNEEQVSIHNQINQDLLLQTSYNDEIQGVTLIVQQHEKTFLQDVLKCYDSQELNFFKCTVTFQKQNKVIFQEYGFGSSKKNAKQVAFMKISPKIHSYYKPDFQIIPPKYSIQPKNIPYNTQLNLNRFNYQVEDNQDIDY